MRLAGRGVLRAFVLLAAFAGLSPAMHAAEKPRLRATDYTIDARLMPQSRRLSARVAVRFVALDDISIATFELHNALGVTQVTDAAGHILPFERITRDSTIRVPLPDGLIKGQEATLIFDYEGMVGSADDSPVPGQKLAYVGDPISYLLYSGRWFPVTNYGIDRFTARMNITAPYGYTVISSGDAAKPPVKSSTRGDDKFTTFHFEWTKPSFPGTVIAGKFTETRVTEAGLTVGVYFLPDKAEFAEAYGEVAAREMGYFITIYGVPLSTELKLVELPDDTLSSAWAPEVAAISARNIRAKVNYRLLSNAVAHQWFGTIVSPARRSDWWIQEGGARYSEARYIQYAAGEAGAQEAVKDLAVGALAYESLPLGQIGTLDTFDPVFQAMANDKGGMVYHMLRWVMGDARFDKTMRTLFARYAGKSVGLKELQKIAEEVEGESMTWFFSEWLDSTGAPEFRNKYTIYRVKKGFRIVGQLRQDLDLFRMPVQMRIDTDGQSEEKIIDIVGPESGYVVETFGKPRKITIDPNNWVLRNSSELRLRSAIMRGQQFVQQGALGDSIREFQKAIELNANSSLAHYRLAEVYYMQHNYQSAANSYRDALNGDGEPRWTEVWAHVQLGKIFDLTGQRERATGEYRQALQTNDNTQGALNEAGRYLNSPYLRDEN